MDFYSKEDYRKAHVEFLEILKYISQEDVNKIPKEYIQFCIEDSDINYKFIYNPNIKFEEQNIMKLTKTLIANVYIKYWATAKRKEEIKNDFVKKQVLKKKSYNYGNLFNKKCEPEINKTEEKSLEIVKKSFISRIIDMFRKMLN